MSIVAPAALMVGSSVPQGLTSQCSIARDWPSGPCDVSGVKSSRIPQGKGHCLNGMAAAVRLQPTSYPGYGFHL